MIKGMEVVKETSRSGCMVLAHKEVEQDGYDLCLTGLAVLLVF